jgi:hypothetical protein
VPQRAQAVATGDDPDQPAVRDHGQPVHPGVQHGLGGPADRLCGACGVHGATHDGLDGAVAPEQQVGLEDRQRPGDVGVAQEHVAIAEHADHPALDHDRQMADAVEPHHPAGIEHGRPRRHCHGVWGHPLFEAHLSFLCVLAIDRHRPDVLSTSSGCAAPAGSAGRPAAAVPNGPSATGSAGPRFSAGAFTAARDRTGGDTTSAGTALDGVPGTA